MSATVQRSPFWPAARVTFTAALALFAVTIVIGILNGLDLYEPDHDTLITHVHAGTLGWITLATSGAALLMFSGSHNDTDNDRQMATRLAWVMTAAITLYVLAFFAGDRIPGDRIQRPIFGTVLLVVVVWFAVWLFSTNQQVGSSSIARLGLLLAWISLTIGAILGILLGIYTSKGEIPGLDNDTAAAVSEGHPPAMVIGFLILAAMAVIEWLFREHEHWSEDRLGVAQMWILFAAGMLANIGFLAAMEEELLGPANLLMIVGVVIMVIRYRRELAPSGWRGAGSGTFVRMSSVFLVVYLVLGTILIANVVSGNIDFDALTEAQEGLLLGFDHTMFIGVMTNLLFGAVVLGGLGRRMLSSGDRVVLWGVNLGIVGFLTGLLAVSPVLKRISTPVMGTALLIGIVLYIREMSGSAVTEVSTRG
ncbi:MAG: hypothetical protein KDB69_09360 [Acidimicrobiia bacterium]|nr:hypothetical protein [Acidimicrobiia bacterium]